VTEETLHIRMLRDRYSVSFGESQPGGGEAGDEKFEGFEVLRQYLRRQRVREELVAGRWLSKEEKIRQALRDLVQSGTVNISGVTV
jgi:hypothetical protein